MTVETSEKARFGRLAGRVLARYIGMVRRTSSVAFEPADAVECLAAANPAIVALWHGQFLMVPTLQSTDVETHVMVARHGDAEAIAEVLRHYGSELIRGAGAGGRQRDRGGAQALRAALRSLESGVSVAMTADVPPGPARRVGLGIVTLARLSGCPILPVAVASNRFRSLDTWSRMTINLPFSRIGAVVGDPIRVARDASADDVEAARVAVEAALNAATARAYDLCGGDARRATPASVRARNGEPVPAGLTLSAYRHLTRAATPLLPLLISYRRSKGKEDAARSCERLGFASAARPTGTLAWLHAASVGETLAILPVIAEMKARRPDIGFLLTTGTVTSARIAAERAPAGVLHQYVPLDAPRYVRRFLDSWRPDLAVFTESDVWPNILLEADRRRIPMALVNARMSSRSYKRWRRRRNVARPLFGRFAVVLAQNERLARRFGDLGARDPVVAGNLKIDSPPPPVDEAKLAELQASLAGRPCFLAASTHPGEEDVVTAAHRIIASRHPRVLTILAPRHPDRGPQIAEALAARGFSVSCRAAGTLPGPDTEIYVADTLGELGTLYALVPFAFIGGSLVPHGGQNPIEAARRGAAILSGPHTGNFADEYAALRRAGGALVVQSADELAERAAQLLTDPTEAEHMQLAAERALEALSGALDKTVSALIALIGPVRGGDA